MVTARPDHVALAGPYDRTARAGRRNRSLDKRFAELLRGDVEHAAAPDKRHRATEDRLTRRGCGQCKLDHRPAIADREAAGPARRFVLVADAEEVVAAVIAVDDFALAEDGRIRDGAS
jgi:hypothetical protein